MSDNTDTAYPILNTAYRLSDITAMFVFLARMESLSIEEYVGEPKESDLLKIDVNLFTCNASIRMIYDEFFRNWWEKNEKQESREDTWKNYLHNDEGINGDSNATRENQERFKAMDVNDGLGNLDDYLILYDDPHYVEKEERRFKERVTIIEYEQDVLLQPNESMSQAFERIFCEMNKGWPVTRMT
ncbi:hypothetical protein Tco_0855972 [Tanacetum coccineum]